MSAKLVTREFGGRHSPQQVLVDAMQYVDGAQCLVVAFIDKDGYICSSWSDSSVTTRLGVLDVAKHRMIDLSKEQP